MTNRIYELGRAIGEGNFSDYMQADWKETKEDFRNISKGAKLTAKKLMPLTYPVLGNLSLPVRKRIEGSLSKDVFNSEKAGKISVFTNSILYGITTTLINNYFGNEPEISGSIELGAIGAIFIGGAEGIARIIENKGADYRASLLGKLVSLPIEAGMGIYDGIKLRNEKNE